MKNTVTARDSRARRLARSQGMIVQKHRRLGYLVADPHTRYLLSSQYGMDLDELEDWLAS